MAGLEPLTGGGIAFDGSPVDRLPTHRRGFALMFQDGQLFGHLTVARNVGYALRLRRTPVHATRVRELLALVGLEGYDDRLPATLSGGERQRVALARALAVEPRLLLLDEPLSALDASLRERLAVDLRAILRAAGTTALMVTHDHEEAFTVADRLAVMRAGRGGAVGADRCRVGGTRPTRPRRCSSATHACWSAYRPDVSSPRPGCRTPPASRCAAPRSSPGEGDLVGTVVSARATPELVRLVVTVDGMGELDAVAPPGSHVAPGEPVHLRVDPTQGGDDHLTRDRVGFTGRP